MRCVSLGIRRVYFPIRSIRGFEILHSALPFGATLRLPLTGFGSEIDLRQGTEMTVAGGVGDPY